MNISLVFASLICLATPLGNALRIVQPYHVVANDGQATVKCGYSTPPRPTPQELRVTLLKGLHGAEAVCGGYVNSTHRSVRTPEPNACQASMSEDGLSVSLSGLKGDDTDMYRCVVEVIYPPPYMKRVGNGTLVYVPGEREARLLPTGIPAPHAEASRGAAVGCGPGDRTDADPGRQARLEGAVGGAPLTSGDDSGDSDSAVNHLSDGRD
ncbi:cytotoxic T-lymphocyte protein 4 isoform X2 [Clupea harengus]|uniref:Cytotoxic T-lymphocyte protein 4 isoform X2 n=1 Tax=Clupea harengus TaxID=7950 RepID=A0A6P8GC79_CLUHA|nr:cytotoxic T-lymphocyte protein 4 isoform X2 [Clupea harengus]